jgi:predicted enzyme related to lactoylglutathione lyase
MSRRSLTVEALERQQEEDFTMSNAEVRGKFIWHELLTTDTAAAGAFYTKVLPWRTQPSNMPGYTIFMAGQSQIAGLMALPSEGGTGTPAHWLVYIGTPNVDATCSQAQGLGARLCKAATDIPNVGRFAVLADPQGATFAVFTPSGGPPPTGGSANGTFTWHELATTDVAAALRFYGTLFGWSKGVAHDMGAMGVYQIFEHGGAGVGGMANTQGPSTPPSWLSYVNVADSNRAVTSAKAAGGRLLHGPVEVPGGSWIALFMDPQGGAFAVQEMPRPVTQAKPASPPPKPAATSKAVSAAAPAAASKPKPAPAPKKKAPKKKVARKKAAKKKAPKKAARKKVARKPARRKAAKKKVARKSARRSAPRKRAKRGRRR